MFGFKAALGLILFMGAFLALEARWKIGIDPQQVPCIVKDSGDHARVFLIRKGFHENKLSRGSIIAINLPQKAQEIMAELDFSYTSSIMLKRVAGLSGDEVILGPEGITVNGDVVVAETNAGPALQSLESNLNITIPDGHLFLVGDTLTSFDSRYWGTVHEDEIIGHARVVY